MGCAIGKIRICLEKNTQFLARNVCPPPLQFNYLWEEKKIFHVVECKSERGAIPLIKRTIKKGNEFSELYRLLKILDAKLGMFPVKEPKGVREGRRIV